MSISEFDLIKKYFIQQPVQRPDVILGVGDDAAILDLPSNKQLVVTTDTIVANVHFLEDWSAADIAHRALAVNLSDLAAMGAEPAWVTLALTLPEVDETWMLEFCEGLYELAEQHKVQLIGGDISQGPLSITIQAHGFVDSGKALRRDGAKPGDLIYVTGSFGAPGLALKSIYNEINLLEKDKITVMQKLLQPMPRLQESQAVVGLASAAVDVSDGLAADLGHILEASRVGATLNANELPIDKLLLHYLEPAEAIQVALCSGDEYELCFTVPPKFENKIETLNSKFDCGFTKIGEIDKQSDLRCFDEQGDLIKLDHPGYEHFAKQP